LRTDQQANSPITTIPTALEPGWVGPEGPTVAPTGLSVVLPALNEADHLPATLRSLGRHEGVQVIVADGGSEDDTCEVALSMGAQVVRSEPSRGRQMNAGAGLATGAHLLFLHADTLVPSNYMHTIAGALSDESVAAGAFRLRVDSDRPIYRLVEWSANRRTQRRHLPYGDQAIFMRRDVFMKLGGWPDTPVMEDYAMMMRLRRLGRIAMVNDEVITSARRWERNGPIRTTLQNQACIWSFRAGVSLVRIAEWRARSAR